MNDFYRRMKLKARFTCNTKVKEQTEKYIFKVPTNKKWHHVKIITLPKLSQKQQKTESKMNLN